MSSDAVSNITPLAVETRSLVKAFGNSKVLRGVDLCAPTGTTLAILGANGAGKTTLIKLLSGIMCPSSGQVIITGLELKDNARKVRSLLGLVAHQSYLYGNLTAWENLDFYARMYGVEKRETRISDMLKLVGLEVHRHSRFSTFSRGMQQRMALARALLHHPSILLLDEPETGLDQQGLGAIWDILRYEGANRTIIFASHSFERALSVCDNIAILGRGRIVYHEQACNLNLAGLQQKYAELTQVVKS
ncbi:MAG: ABC transporter ATP-binding protein [Dehalococcoidia bacterium]|nr:ABC transporter ATP-binding protein [Dehalococcoidia bacterium]